jgi:hypothetical protein
MARGSSREGLTAVTSDLMESFGTSIAFHSCPMLAQYGQSFIDLESYEPDLRGDNSLWQSVGGKGITDDSGFQKNSHQLDQHVLF